MIRFIVVFIIAWNLAVPLCLAARARVAAGDAFGLEMSLEKVTELNGQTLDIPPFANAVALNVTAVKPTGSGYFTVWPCSVSRPLASSLNFSPGDIVANGVIAPFGRDSTVCFYSLATTDAVVDVAGWFQGDAFVGITPTRVADTRNGTGGFTGKVQPSHPLRLDVTGLSLKNYAGQPLQMPSTVSAVSVNVTAVDPAGAGYLTVYPCDQPRPLASNVNYVKGEVVANGAIVPTSANGYICVYSSTSADVVVDLVGYFPADSGAFYGATPTRLVDTRNGTGWSQGRSTPAHPISIPIRGKTLSGGGTHFVVPTDATAAALNITAVAPAASGYATVWPCGSKRPLASNLNFAAGATVANNVIAPIGANGSVCIYTNVPTDIVVDMSGYFSIGAAGSFRPTSPTRLLDTRVAPPKTLVSAGQNITTMEQSTISARGRVLGIEPVSSVAWTEILGPQLTIDNADTLTPTITIPAVANNTSAMLQLQVTLGSGKVMKSDVSIAIKAYPRIANNGFPDAALQQCVTDTANKLGITDVKDLHALSCSGVHNLAGLEKYSLQKLTLTNSSVDDYSALYSMKSLTSLDLSSETDVPCAALDKLQKQLGSGLNANEFCRMATNIELGNNGQDMALDSANNLVYVSVPDSREIAIVSLADRRIIDTIHLPGEPYGIDLSLNGKYLFVALMGNSAFAVIDLATHAVQVHQLNLTGSPDTYDIVEAAPNRLFITSNSGGTDLARVVQYDLTTDTESMVANNRIIGANPDLVPSPNADFVYIGEGFIPNSLYKLSLQDSAADIVLDNQSSVAETYNLAVNTSDTRIATAFGQVLNTTSFAQEGKVHAGVSYASTTGNTLSVAASSGRVLQYDFNSLAQTGEFATGCAPAQTVDKLIVPGSQQSAALLINNDLCLSMSLDRNSPPAASHRVIFLDLGLEDCVAAAMQAAGITDPAKLTALDCSNSTRVIRNLAGIDQLANLQSLDISNSGVYDLSPVSKLASLQSLSINGTRVADASPLLNMPMLATLTANNDPNITCRSLISLASQGVAITAPNCSESQVLELGGNAQAMVLNGNRSQAFVSIPSLQQVAQIDLTNLSFVNRTSLPGQPYGIDLSQDGKTLYAALHGQGAVAYVDIASQSVQTHDITSVLGDDRTWDVAAVAPDQLLVSASPGSSGFSYIVKLTNNGADAMRVANGTAIGFSPTFIISPDHSIVYIAAIGNRYALDATDPTFPILQSRADIQQDAYQMSLNSDGTRAYLGSGQVIDTATFKQVGIRPPGRTAFSIDGSKLMIVPRDIGQPTTSVTYYDSQAYDLGSRAFGCSFNDLKAFAELPNDGLIAVGDDLLCVVRVTTY